MIDETLKKQFEALGIESELPKKSDVKQGYSERTKATILAITKELMNTPDGRQWLYYQLDLCRTFNAPFVAGNPDISQFFAGAQAIGLKIFDDIMAVAPENFATMLQEEKVRKIGESNQNQAG